MHASLLDHKWMTALLMLKERIRKEGEMVQSGGRKMRLDIIAAGKLASDATHSTRLQGLILPVLPLRLSLLETSCSDVVEEEC